MRAAVTAVAVATGILITTSTYALQPLEPGQRVEQGQPVQPGQPAQPGLPPSGPTMRDSTLNRHLGLFFRPDLGFGYMASKEPTGNPSLGDATISGPAVVFGVAVGGAVAENVILAGHLYGSTVPSPKVSFSTGAPGGTSSATLSMVGVGPELTYYFMPSNVYISGTLAVTRMTATQNNVSASSDAGFGLKAAIGKEWWVGDRWGLGVAGAFNYNSNNDNGPTMSTWGLGFALSLTYG